MEIAETIFEVSAVEARTTFFEKLYVRAFPVFARFAAGLNASFEDTRDVFQDALVIYYQKVVEEGFQPRTTPEAYVVGIAKHLWIRKYHRDSNRVSLDEMERDVAIADDFWPTVNESRLLGFVERTGRKCLELLRRFYYDGIALRDIAAALGYRNEHAATVQKYRCIGKLREAIKTKAIDYEDFLS